MSRAAEIVDQNHNTDWNNDYPDEAEKVAALITATHPIWTNCPAYEKSQFDNTPDAGRHLLLTPSTSYYYR